MADADLGRLVVCLHALHAVQLVAPVKGPLAAMAAERARIDAALHAIRVCANPTHGTRGNYTPQILKEIDDYAAQLGSRVSRANVTPGAAVLAQGVAHSKQLNAIYSELEGKSVLDAMAALKPIMANMKTAIATFADALIPGVAPSPPKDPKKEADVFTHQNIPYIRRAGIIAPVAMLDDVYGNIMASGDAVIAASGAAFCVRACALWDQVCVSADLYTNRTTLHSTYQTTFASWSARAAIRRAFNPFAMSNASSANRNEMDNPTNSFAWGVGYARARAVQFMEHATVVANAESIAARAARAAVRTVRHTQLKGEFAAATGEVKATRKRDMAVVTRAQLMDMKLAKFVPSMLISVSTIDEKAAAVAHYTDLAGGAPRLRRTPEKTKSPMSGARYVAFVVFRACVIALANADDRVRSLTAVQAAATRPLPALATALVRHSEARRVLNEALRALSQANAHLAATCLINFKDNATLAPSARVSLEPPKDRAARFDNIIKASVRYLTGTATLGKTGYKVLPARHAFVKVVLHAAANDTCRGIVHCVGIVALLHGAFSNAPPAAPITLNRARTTANTTTDITAVLRAIVDECSGKFAESIFLKSTLPRAMDAAIRTRIYHLVGKATKTPDPNATVKELQFIGTMAYPDKPPTPEEWRNSVAALAPASLGSFLGDIETVFAYLDRILTNCRDGIHKTITAHHALLGGNRKGNATITKRLAAVGSAAVAWASAFVDSAVLLVRVAVHDVLLATQPALTLDAAQMQRVKGRIAIMPPPSTIVSKLTSWIGEYAARGRAARMDAWRAAIVTQAAGMDATAGDTMMAPVAYKYGVSLRPPGVVIDEFLARVVPSPRHSRAIGIGGADRRVRHALMDANTNDSMQQIAWYPISTAYPPPTAKPAVLTPAERTKLRAPSRQSAKLRRLPTSAKDGATLHAAYAIREETMKAYMTNTLRYSIAAQQYRKYMRMRAILDAACFRTLDTVAFYVDAGLQTGTMQRRYEAISEKIERQRISINKVWLSSKAAYIAARDKLSGIVDSESDSDDGIDVNVPDVEDVFSDGSDNKNAFDDDSDSDIDTSQLLIPAGPTRARDMVRVVEYALQRTYLPKHPAIPLDGAYLRTPDLTADDIHLALNDDIGTLIRHITKNEIANAATLGDAQRTITDVRTRLGAIQAAYHRVLLDMGNRAFALVSAARGFKLAKLRPYIEDPDLRHRALPADKAPDDDMDVVGDDELAGLRTRYATIKKANDNQLTAINRSVRTKEITPADADAYAIKKEFATEGEYIVDIVRYILRVSAGCVVRRLGWATSVFWRAHPDGGGSPRTPAQKSATHTLRRLTSHAGAIAGGLSDLVTLDDLITPINAQYMALMQYTTLAGNIATLAGRTIFPGIDGRLGRLAARLAGLKTWQRFGPKSDHRRLMKILNSPGYQLTKDSVANNIRVALLTGIDALRDLSTGIASQSSAMDQFNVKLATHIATMRATMRAAVARDRSVEPADDESMDRQLTFDAFAAPLAMNANIKQLRDQLKRVNRLLYLYVEALSIGIPFANDDDSSNPRALIGAAVKKIKEVSEQWIKWGGRVVSAPSVLYPTMWALSAVPRAIPKNNDIKDNKTSEDNNKWLVGGAALVDQWGDVIYPRPGPGAYTSFSGEGESGDPLIDDLRREHLAAIRKKNEAPDAAYRRQLAFEQAAAEAIKVDTIAALDAGQMWPLRDIGAENSPEQLAADQGFISIEDAHVTAQASALAYFENTRQTYVAARAQRDAIQRIRVDVDTHRLAQLDDPRGNAAPGSPGEANAKATLNAQIKYEDDIAASIYKIKLDAKARNADLDNRNENLEGNAVTGHAICLGAIESALGYMPGVYTAYVENSPGIKPPPYLVVYYNRLQLRDEDNTKKNGDGEVEEGGEGDRSRSGSDGESDGDGENDDKSDDESDGEYIGRESDSESDDDDDDGNVRSHKGAAYVPPARAAAPRPVAAPRIWRSRMSAAALLL